MEHPNHNSQSVLVSSTDLVAKARIIPDLFKAMRDKKSEIDILSIDLNRTFLSLNRLSLTHFVLEALGLHEISFVVCQVYHCQVCIACRGVFAAYGV